MTEPNEKPIKKRIVKNVINLVRHKHMFVKNKGRQ